MQTFQNAILGRSKHHSSYCAQHVPVMMASDVGTTGQLEQFLLRHEFVLRCKDTI